MALKELDLRSDQQAAVRATVDMAKVEVVAPNLKRRLSGVTSTIVQLIPLQARMMGIATLGRRPAAESAAHTLVAGCLAVAAARIGA